MAKIPEQYGDKWQGEYDKEGRPVQSSLRCTKSRTEFDRVPSWIAVTFDGLIGEVRKEMRRLTSAKSSPKRLWGYLGCLVAAKRQRTASNIPSMMGRTGFEMIHGYTPDISLYILHEWYDFVVHWYDIADKSEKLGRWLGPSGESWGGGDCHYVVIRTNKYK